MMIKILFKSCVGLVMIYEIEKYFQNCMSQIRKLLKGVVTPTHKDYTKGTYIYHINNVCLLKIVDNRPNTWSRVYQLVLLYQIKRQQVPVCLRSPKQAWAKNSQVTHKQLKFKYFTKH